MQIYTQNEIQVLYEAQLSSIAQQAYVEPELEERLTSQIQAKRAELNAKRKDQKGIKTDKLAVLGVLEEELNNLIAEDAEIAAANETAKQTARETAASGESDGDNQELARLQVVSMILRESDSIVSADNRISSTDLDSWVEYRELLRDWVIDGVTIPESPEEPEIDPTATTIIERLEDTDDAIIGLMEAVMS